MSDDPNIKSVWANIGNVAKIFARSIDTKNCKITKKGLFFAVLPTIGSVFFYVGKDKNSRWHLENYLRNIFDNKSSWYQQQSANFKREEPQRDFTYYNVLGINKNSDANSIRKSYLRLMKNTHPDKGGTRDAFKILRAAYDCLSNTSSKRDYDNWLIRNYSLAGENFHKLMTPDVIQFFKEFAE